MPYGILVVQEGGETRLTAVNIPEEMAETHRIESYIRPGFKRSVFEMGMAWLKGKALPEEKRIVFFTSGLMFAMIIVCGIAIYFR